MPDFWIGLIVGASATALCGVVTIIGLWAYFVSLADD